jgi:hypothetical protein
MIHLQEIAVPRSSKYRYFVLRYPPSSPWTSQDFFGLVISRDFEYFAAILVAEKYPPTSDPDWLPDGFLDVLLNTVPNGPLTENGYYVAGYERSLTPCPSKCLSKSYWKRALRSVAKRLSNGIVYDESEMALEERRLGQTACDSFRPVEANTLSTILELKGLKSEIGDWMDALTTVGKSIKRPAKFVRALGNLRLSTKWGIPLTVGDARAIADQLTDDIVYGVSRNDWQSSRARTTIKARTKRGLFPQTTEVKIDVCLKAYVSKYDSRIKKAASTLFDYNVISLSNAWDMIPYSFVVDWFTNVGERIELIDSTMYKETFLDVRGSVLSHRWEVRVPTEVWQTLLGIPISNSDVTFCFYQREILDHIPWPHLEDKELSSNLGVNQYLDGGILILQRIPE